MLRILLGLFLLSSFHIINGQSNCDLRLYGFISDEHDGSELAYANLILIDSSNNQIVTGSDVNGKYEMGSLCPGAYQMVITHIGCKADTISFKLSSDLKFDHQLEHHWKELEEVEVQSAQTVYKEQDLSEESIDRNRGENMAEMIKSLPGVNTFKTGSNISKPMIGGFTSNRVQIVNQGVQHINQNWGDEHAPEIDPFAYVNYKVIKGAGALKYGGGAIGGIVLLDPKPMRSENGIGGMINGVYASNNRMYSPSLLLEGNHLFLPKFSWRAQASYKRSGNIQSPDYYQDNTGVEEENFSYALQWLEESWKANVSYSLNKSTIGIFRGAHIGNLTDLRNILESGEPRDEYTQGFSYDIDRPYQLITHELFKLGLTKYFKSSKLDLQFSRQFNIREEFDKDLPRNDALAALNLPEFSLSLESYHTNLNYEVKLDEFLFDLGGGMLMKDNTVNSFVDFIPDYQSVQYHLFGVGQWQRGPWNIETALRIDLTEMDVDKYIQRELVSSAHDYEAFSANIGVSRNLHKNSIIRLSFNYAERAPAINELYSEGLHHGSASLEYGDPDLKKEKASSIRLGFDQSSERFKMNLDLYAQWINDFIYLEPDGIDLNIRGAFPRYQWKNTEAFLRGMDLMLQFNISEPLKISQKSSLLLANQGSDYLVNMPANRIEHTLDYTFQKARLNFYFGHLYVAKQDRYDEEVEIVEPPDAYQLLHIGGMKEIDLSDKIKGKIGLRINNLLNTSYRDYLNRFRFYADEMGRDIRLTLELKF